MIAPQQHSIQESPPNDLLAKLCKRLDYRCRELTEESAIDPAVALERGYYLEKTKRGLERLGFKRSQQRAPALVMGNVSGVSRAFPFLETGFSAYLSGIRSSVSAFPPFPAYREGAPRG